MVIEEFARDPGSFRDPSGFIFFYRENPYRTLDQSSFTVIQQLNQQGLFQELQDKGYLIPTEIVPENSPLFHALKKNLPEEHFFLSHKKILVINYPYEWTISMLADAAKLQLQLQLELINKGFSLKDASAFNVQFVSSKPLFIDILSIEPIPTMEVWLAFGQFCQMHLFPIMLKRYKNISLRSCLLGSIEGLSVEEAYHMFGFFGALRPALLLDVLLQYISHKVSLQKEGDLKKKIEQKGSSTAPQIINLKRMIRKIDKLTSKYRYTGHWTDYSKTKTYSKKSESEKLRYLEHFLKDFSPRTVLDLGCNTGQYSFLAAENGADVIAVDSDHDCVDLLYQRASKEKAPILPLCIDISNPSPALGFRHRERKSFLDRIRADAVFALALVHHLLITSRIPLPGIRDCLYELTNRYLVIEFIDRRDEMFQQLLALRKDIYNSINHETFVSVFLEKFELIREQNISHANRILFTFRKKC